jgi:hypothetical protein
LVHSNSFTLPDNVTVLVSSNMEKEWCADADAVKAATAMAARPMAFTFMMPPSEISSTIQRRLCAGAILNPLPGDRQEKAFS